MKCPHCAVEIHDHSEEEFLEDDVQGNHVGWAIFHQLCPSCDALILFLGHGEYDPQTAVLMTDEGKTLIFPRGGARPCPVEVPDHLAEDFKEACLVLVDSPKASAALSRRCLQGVLRDKGFNQHNLYDQIQAVLDGGTLPSHLSDSIDAIRKIGNLAAHEKKNMNTGEILPVEPGEAEWTLDVLEDLFDFYYVQPAKTKAKWDALNKKLQS